MNENLISTQAAQAKHHCFDPNSQSQLQQPLFCFTGTLVVVVVLTVMNTFCSSKLNLSLLLCQC